MTKIGIKKTSIFSKTFVFFPIFHNQLVLLTNSFRTCISTSYCWSCRANSESTSFLIVCQTFQYDTWQKTSFHCDMCGKKFKPRGLNGHKNACRKKIMPTMFSLTIQNLNKFLNFLIIVNFSIFFSLKSTFVPSTFTPESGRSWIYEYGFYCFLI